MIVNLRTAACPALILLSLLICVSCCRHGDAGQVKNADKTFTIEALYTDCNSPMPCRQKAACEGKRVWVSGWIDPYNIFHKGRYPQLSYEKFFLKSKSGKILEVIVQGDESPSIFEKIKAFKTSNIIHVSVQGIIEGADLPIMGKCRRGLRLIIHKAHQIRAVR